MTKFFGGKRFHFVAAAAVAMLAMTMVADVAVASNMGFKMNKQLNTGINLVSTPFRSPLGFARDLCNAFGKGGDAGVSMTEFSGTGSVSYTCDQIAVTGFALTKDGVGVLVINNTAATTGIVVGAHKPGTNVTIKAAGQFPQGTHLYAYPYHTTNAFARDICNDSGMSTTDPVSVVRFGAGGSQAYTCDQVAITGFALALGEAVLVQGQPAQVTFVPSHF